MKKEYFGSQKLLGDFDTKIENFEKLYPIDNFIFDD